MRTARPRRRIAAGIAALGCAFTVTAVAAPAAQASAGRYCGTYGTGSAGSTIWYKQPPGCRDFNITWVKWDGLYAGWYWTKSHWQLCSEGFVYRTGGQTWDQVACSNVVTGTALTVSGTIPPGSSAPVRVNY